MELIFVSNGKQFTSIIDAIAYAFKDRLADQVLSALLTTNNPKFATGEGYLQHPAEEVRCLKEILHFVYGKEADTEELVTIKEMRTGLEKLDLPYLQKIWNKVACIDNQNREWAQPYYATEANNNGRPDAVALMPETNQPWKN